MIIYNYKSNYERINNIVITMRMCIQSRTFSNVNEIKGIITEINHLINNLRDESKFPNDWVGYCDLPRNQDLIKELKDLKRQASGVALDKLDE